MTKDRFFRGFLAALRKVGEDFIRTRGDAHHKNFEAVVDLMERSGSEDLPLFIPSPFSGRFRELEDALLQMQRGFLGAQNPFYPGVHLDITEQRAEAILDQYTLEERERFLNLAKAFKAKATAETLTVDNTQG